MSRRRYLAVAIAAFIGAVATYELVVTGKVAISVWAENIVVPPGETAYIRFPTADVTPDNLNKIEIIARMRGKCEAPQMFVGIQLVTFEPPNLVARWAFDEGQGTVAYDTLGVSNMNIYGATWTSDAKQGPYALYFDGVDDYAEAPDTPNLRLTKEATLAFWVKTSDPTKPFYAYKGLGTIFRSYTTRIYWDGKQFHLGFCTSYMETWWLVSYSLQPDMWYHLVFTVKPNEQKFYVNGTLVDSKSYYYDYLDPWSGYPFRINKSPWVPYGFGIIDDVRLYNRALTADEVYKLYQMYIPQPVKVLELPEAVVWDLNYKIMLFGPNYPRPVEAVEREEAKEIERHTVIFMQNLTYEQAEKILANPVLGIVNRSKLYPLKVKWLMVKVNGIPISREVEKEAEEVTQVENVA
jgi:hypothetical protein